MGFVSRVLTGPAVHLSLKRFNWGVVYEYNVVVGLFKLELAIYLHGDLKLKEKADVLKVLYTPSLR
jgi:hypothetical protein